VYSSLKKTIGHVNCCPDPPLGEVDKNGVNPGKGVTVSNSVFISVCKSGSVRFLDPNQVQPVRTALSIPRNWTEP
jgi:hypothetical protein